MAYIGKTPASAALTSSDISDGIISTAKIANDAATADKIANAVNSAITANTAKTGISSAQTSAITANTSKATNATHSGEVTGSGALTIAGNVVDEANLKVSNNPTNGYLLSAQSGNTGGMTWVTAPSAEAGIPYWRSYKQGNQTCSNNASTEITFNNNEDPYSGFSSNKFIVPSGKGGLYLLGAAIMFSTNTTGGSMRMSIRVGVSGNPGAGTVESGMSHGGTYTSTTGSVLRNLAEGAYVSLYLYNATGGDLVAYGTTGTVNFWGTRIK